MGLKGRSVIQVGPQRQGRQNLKKKHFGKASSPARKFSVHAADSLRHTFYNKVNLHKTQSPLK